MNTRSGANDSLSDDTSVLLERLAAIVSAIEPERLYDTVLSAVGDALDAQSGVLWVGEKDLVVAATRGLPASGGRLDRIRADGPLAARIAEGRPFAWPENAGPGTAQRPAIRIPLLHRDRVHGLLELADPLDGRPFGERERAIAARYAPFCAIALSNVGAMQAVKRKSLKDPETETYNLLYFVDYAGKEIYKARRYGRKFSVLVLKLDNHSVLKQTVAAPKLKDLIKGLVDCLRTAIREADTIAKVADDELWLLLPETDHLGARLLVQKAFRAIGKDRRFREIEPDHPLLLTMGTATFPRDGSDFDSLLATCRSRLEDFRQSLWRKQHLSDLGFWDLVSLFVGEEALYAQLDARLPPKGLAITEDRRGRSRHLVLDPHTWGRIQLEAVEELARNPDVRGVLFAGIGTLSETHDLLGASPRAAASAAPIYVLGRAPRGGSVRVEATNVTAVPVEDAAIVDHELLFLLTEVAAYAFVGRRGKGGAIFGYHTADPVLVESLVARLQEQYYLQGRF